MMASDAFVAEIRGKTDALQKKWMAEAKAKGLEDPADVLQTYTALSRR